MSAPSVRLGVETLFVRASDTLLDAMRVINGAPGRSLPAGLALVIDDGSELVGVVTDGDIRGALLTSGSLDDHVESIMSRNPVVLRDATDPSGWLDDIRQQLTASGRGASISHAVLVDEQHRAVGLVEVDDLLLEAREAPTRVGVIGLGFVGLTLAVALAERGVDIVCFERSSEIVELLCSGGSHVHEVGLVPAIAAQRSEGRLLISDRAEDLAHCSVYVVCVNTPVVGESPRLEDLEGALLQLAPMLNAGDVIVLRSTVPVGASRGVTTRVVESATNLRVGADVGVAFAPERTVAGNALEELRQLPQVVAGIDSRSATVAERLFSRLSPSIIRLDHLEEAELVKLANNTFRDVSFAFANEIAALCERHNVSARNVLAAANVGYPRNPIPSPSPGVGGPCLTKDPFILAAADDTPERPSLVRAARAINQRMPIRIAERVLASYRELGGDPSAATVCVLGLAFKSEPETNDVRSSPSIDVIERLRPHVRSIVGWDAAVGRDAVSELGIEWFEPDAGFHDIDIVIAMHNHRRLSMINPSDMTAQLRRPSVVFDGFDVFEPLRFRRTPDLRYLDISWSSPVVS